MYIIKLHTDKSRRLGGFLHVQQIQIMEDSYVSKPTGSLGNNTGEKYGFTKNHKHQSNSSKRIDKTGAAILRIGLFEILYEEETPNIVAINEAVELAKKYSDDNVRKIINAVLDKIINEIDKYESQKTDKGVIESRSQDFGRER